MTGDSTLANVRTEWLDIRTLDQHDMELVAARLPQRLGKAQKFLHEDDRLRSIGAGLFMLRLGLRDEADIEYGPHGKPEVAYLPSFNISHSGDYVVMAIGDMPVGVDVERPRPGYAKIAPRVFDELEQAWMNEDAPERRFCQLWTCKEAVMKLFGEGLRMDPRSFNVMGLVHGGSAIINGLTLGARFEVRDEYVLTAVAQLED